MSSSHYRQSLQRLLRDERGTLLEVAKDRIGLVYPSPYRAAMSSLGYQTIYRTLNGLEDWSCERLILPDDAQQALQHKAGILSVEHQRPMRDFPLLAFSVAYELELAGLIDCLRLGGVPPLRRERGPRDPLVIAGGPLTFSNPAPLAPFCDLIVLGEGEELIVDLVNTARELDYDADKVCAHFAGVPGFFVPEHDGEVVPPIARAADECLPARSQIITPNTELSSMFLIETGRGCSRGCTYCVMRRTTNGGMRAVAPDRLLSLIPQDAERVGLVGAAVTDHPKIRDIVGPLVDQGRSIGISSLRADKLDDEFVGMLAKGGYRTLTVALDAPSQRMRDEIERVAREEHLLNCAAWTKKHKLRTLKIYMVIGLPGETDEDIDELISFAHRLRKEHHRIAFGIAPFVAKRNTPLDGEPFAGIKVVDQRLKRLRKGLKGAAEIRPTSSRWAWVEYMLAQGESKAGLALMEAHLAGGRFADYKRAFAAHDCEGTGPRARVLSSREIAAKKRAELQARLTVIP